MLDEKTYSVVTTNRQRVSRLPLETAKKENKNQNQEIHFLSIVMF